MAEMTVKIELTEVTLKLTGEEAAALYALLCFTNPDSPTDGIFTALMNNYTDLPTLTGEWNVQPDNNAIVFKNN